MNGYMYICAGEAIKGVLSNHGGPFGALVVKDGKIVGIGHNRVIVENNPTLHGEMVAIQDACKNLGTFDLTGCELYTSAEPCPMCLSAIMWANIKKVYYGCTVEDTDNIGFRDGFIYDWLQNRNEDVLKMECVDRENCLKAFEVWQEKVDKEQY